MLFCHHSGETGELRKRPQADGHGFSEGLLSLTAVFSTSFIYTRCFISCYPSPILQSLTQLILLLSCVSAPSPHPHPPNLLSQFSISRVSIFDAPLFSTSESKYTIHITPGRDTLCENTSSSYTGRVNQSTPQSTPTQLSSALRGQGNIILSKIDGLKIAQERNRMPTSPLNQ